MYRKKMKPDEQEVISLWIECDVDYARFEFQISNGDFIKKTWTIHTKGKGQKNEKELENLEGYLKIMVHDHVKFIKDSNGKYREKKGEVVVDIQKKRQTKTLLFKEFSFTEYHDNYFFPHFRSIEFIFPMATSKKEAEVFEKYIEVYTNYNVSEGDVTYNSDCILTEKENRIIESLKEKLRARLNESILELFKMEEKYTCADWWLYCLKPTKGPFLVVIASTECWLKSYYQD